LKWDDVGIFEKEKVNKHKKQKKKQKKTQILNLIKISLEWEYYHHITWLLI
jgi:hypothetical protein